MGLGKFLVVGERIFCTEVSSGTGIAITGRDSAQRVPGAFHTALAGFSFKTNTSYSARVSERTGQLRVNRAPWLRLRG